MSSIVYASGTFDLFHSNHLKMINYARGLGDTLIVGVGTDELVYSNKKKLPIVPFEERIGIIEGLKAPDIVIPEYSFDYSTLVDNLNIDCFVMGDDWKGEFDYLKDKGVKVFYFPYGKGASSTNLKNKIYQQYKQILEKTNAR